MVTTRAPSEEGVAHAEIARERRPEPARDVLEREIGGKTFKIGKSLGQAAQDQIIEVIARHLDAFLMVRLGHARHRPRLPVPPPHHGPQGQANPPEKKEVQ